MKSLELARNSEMVQYNSLLIFFWCGGGDGVGWIEQWKLLKKGRRLR